MYFCILTWIVQFVNATTPDPVSGVLRKAMKTRNDTSDISAKISHQSNFWKIGFPLLVLWANDEQLVNTALLGLIGSDSKRIFIPSVTFLLQRTILWWVPYAFYLCSWKPAIVQKYHQKVHLLANDIIHSTNVKITLKCTKNWVQLAM